MAKKPTASGVVVASPPTRPSHIRPHPSKSQTLSVSRLVTATNDLWKSYRQNTPNSLFIIDAFLVFLMYIGAVQFVYAIITGGLHGVGEL